MSDYRPKVIIESHVPHIPESLSGIFNVVRLAPDEITPETVADANALIIRTRTRCDDNLLSGSAIEFIATATIGTDHIDIPYCKNRRIEVISAPGCNAPAVAQYVFASLLTIFPENLNGKTLGVIGVGHVGSIVADWGRQLGMEVLPCDPPRAYNEGSHGFISLEEIAQRADIITFHVPLSTPQTSAYPTYHIADSRFFASLRHPSVIINSARGPVVDTTALVSALDKGIASCAVIDCWENEPDISVDLLRRAAIATPHIAGYSLNGKIRATSTAVNALCRHFGVSLSMNPDIPSGAAQYVTPDSIRSSYNPLNDTKDLKSAFLSPSNDTPPPALFESLRNHYKLRPEVV